MRFLDNKNIRDIKAANEILDNKNIRDIRLRTLWEIKIMFLMFLLSKKIIMFLMFLLSKEKN